MSFDVKLNNIGKTFGTCIANSNVNLHIKKGTIHALLGENGAGKSTAMKILYGIYKQDQGSIEIKNKIEDNLSPQRAFSLGIGMVHQHFMLADSESALDNIVLGVEKSFLGLRQRKREKTQIETIMSLSGLTVPLNSKVCDLPIGIQSRIEIIKVLYRNAEFLILDEPTSVLTPAEIENFLEILKNLRASGKTILLVTHKLREIFSVADEATVLRQGKTVATRKISETNASELAELMVGRKINLPKCKKLALHKNHKNTLSLKTNSFNFNLRSGEILGIAGVEGNGQEKLIKELCNIANPNQFSFIPMDRQKEGLILEFSLKENLRLKECTLLKKSNLKLFESATEEESKLLNEYDVRPNNIELPARSLSGGNQQKLICARELSLTGPEHFVLAVHPTRGVDLGAIEFIHHKLLEKAESEAGVIIISSELEELMSLSHRIGTIYRGKISNWFEPESESFDEKQIGRAMLTGNS